MGVYDTIMIPCPKCGTLEEAQSKSGKCLLNTYSLDNAPAEVMYNVNRHAPFICYKCGTKFMVTYDLITKITNAKTIVFVEDPEE